MDLFLNLCSTTFVACIASILTTLTIFASFLTILPILGVLSTLARLLLRDGHVSHRLLLSEFFVLGITLSAGLGFLELDVRPILVQASPLVGLAVPGLVWASCVSRLASAVGLSGTVVLGTGLAAFGHCGCCFVSRFGCLEIWRGR